MCSLVNAKSGGCAEDCGFCAQSRFADAETPMHAMMEPEQILEHARAAEAAGAHRFCMVTQGQGLSKRDFEKYLEGVRLVSEQTNLKRCASVGHISAERAKALREAGIQRVHHNVETAQSYYDEVTSTVRYEGRLRTIDAVREAGLETCVGGILNLGETREQRVEMAFELAAIDPTSVPINMLNPRPGTKFGDREYMDPWEAVKWIAIFRLILPDALFRLCGGRVENLARAAAARRQGGHQRRDDGQLPDDARQRAGDRPRDVRGARAERRAPAGQRRQPAAGQPLGLARGRDPGRGARAARRRGERRATIDLEVRLWDPSTQLRYRAKRAAPPPRPDGAANRHRQRAGAARERAQMSEIEQRLEELEQLGLSRRLRLVSGPQGPTVLIDGKPVLLLCSNNYLGLADHPRVREAAAEAAMRWGVGAGASRLVSGTMTIHRRLEERLADFKGSESCLLFGSGYLANIGVIGALAGAGDTVFSDELNHASIVDGCRLSRAEVVVYRHRDVEHLEWSLRQHGRRDGARRLIVTDSVFSMDGDVAPLEEIAELAAMLRRARWWSTRRTRPATSAPAAAAPWPRPASRARST